MTRIDELIARWMAEPTAAPYFVNTPTAITDMERQLVAAGLTATEARETVTQVVEHNIRVLQTHVKATRHLLDEHAQGLNDMVARMRAEIRAKLTAEHAGYHPPTIPVPKKRGRKPKQGKLV